MSIFDVIIISLSLSMDNMAVAAASGCRGNKCGAAYMFKVAAAFCAVSLIALTAGWFGGMKLQSFIAGWDHWLAFGLLIYIGAKMIKESLAKTKPDACQTYDMTSLKTLLFLALATNIDVLAIGISLSFYQVKLLSVAGILAVCVSSATILGFTIGRQLGKSFGKRVELLGGATLIILSFKILIEGLK